MAILLTGTLTALLPNATASAVPLLCETITNNHMYVDDSSVAACLDAGMGNLTGNPSNDLFINGAGAGYESAGKSDEGANPFNLTFTRAGNIGTWRFDGSFWDSYTEGAIGFKFGTGNNPDEWFVYSLVNGVFAGDWTFVNLFGKGGGLSHMNLYGVAGKVTVAEPATLALFGLGLVALGFARRRKPAAA
jgi:hypothetical protein